MCYDDCELTALGGITRHENYALGMFDGKDTMIWSRDQAFKPLDKKSPQHKLQNQKAKAHVLLKSSSNNSKKRKLEHYINDDEFANSYELITKEKYGSENVKDQRRNSCSTLSNRKRTSFQETQECGVLAQTEKAEFCGISMEDYSHLDDTNDSIKESSYIMNQKSLNIQARDLMPSSSYSSTTNISIMEKQKMEFVKILVDEVFIDSMTSHSLYSKDADVKLIQSSKNFLPARSNHLPRPVIPVGPRFQAEVPKWDGTTNLKQCNSDDCLKWLGTQIWPMPEVSKTNAIGIGKGRLDSCSCHNPKSVDCVQKHVSEARECLKLVIGTAFSSWKFDDMGEDVSKSWTMEEQTAFESLVKSNPLSSDTKFWKLKMKKYFPSKSMKCMINYYYNVYIPRCMSKATRSPFGAFDGEPK
ncbi:uncharacterized protein [Cicer arietinum]|uniref:Uncharacterized protein LOC101501146 isoform X2 n=1 Tax=Cicer arietinum TaxID=3827 RepID=A0A1S3E0V0_CICAR|nr:uncharacterized protein LOC101501146 isoform X2 [Cicer arietinum]